MGAPATPGTPTDGCSYILRTRNRQWCLRPASPGGSLARFSSEQGHPTIQPPSRGAQGPGVWWAPVLVVLHGVSGSTHTQNPSGEVLVQVIRCSDFPPYLRPASAWQARNSVSQGIPDTPI